MAPPRATDAYQRRIAALTAALIVAARRAWRRMDAARPLEQQYSEDVGPKLALLLFAAQLATARTADTYIADVLNELDFGPTVQPGVLRPAALVGVRGNGLPATDLLESTIARTRAIESRTGASTAEALVGAQDYLEGILETILADTARAAEEAASAARPWVAGYVRVAEPGACSRCIILAGKFYAFNDGFLRHPRCRCSHVPAPGDRAEVDGLRAINSPDRYFDSLSRKEQDRIFTEAGAEAIRNGADIAQVVNVRKGMTKATSGRLVRNADGLFTTTASARRGRARLMPESIFEIAGDDRDEAIRLLRAYGYIR